MTTLVASFPSPSQGVWHLGSLPIRAYAMFIVAGIVAALLLGNRRWIARGGEPGVVYDVAIWAIPFGLIGGRLYHVITDWRTYFGDDGLGLGATLRIWDGGLGIWGAVALGGVGAWIGCRRRGIPLPAFGDAVAPGIVLAQAIGRIGNYFNQELYGRPTDLPWGLEIYYRREPSGVVDVHSVDGVSTGQVAEVVHPTFLYESLWPVRALCRRLLCWSVLRRVDAQRRDPNCRHPDQFIYCHVGIDRTATLVLIGALIYFFIAPKGREDLGFSAAGEAEATRDAAVGRDDAAARADSGVDSGDATPADKGLTSGDARTPDNDRDSQSEKPDRLGFRS